MRITALETQARNVERISVFVDGNFLLGVNAEIVLQMGLAVGQDLLLAQVEELRHAEALQQAVERAYNYLSYRPRSRAEVRRYLRRHETAPDILEAVVERLDSLELINDRAFAAFWAETRARFSPRGTRALKSELRSKGVEQEVIEEVLNEEQDEELALRAGRKKALSLVRVPDMDAQTFRIRLGSFLQRRGFGYEISKRTVQALWKELREEEDESD